MVPVYREQGNIAPLFNAVATHLADIGLRYEVIFVDDGSTDDTWPEIVRLTSFAQSVRGVRLSRNFGKESAIRAGLDAARGDLLVFIDGDLQHPPGLIRSMVERWRVGDVHVVEAIKEHRGGEGVVSRIGARCFHHFFNVFSGFDLAGASDFKLLDRTAVSALLEMKEKNLFFRGMTEWIGFPRARISFSVSDRIKGRSKWSLFKLARLAITAMTSFSSAPLQLVTAMGFLFFIFAAVMAADSLVNKIIGRAVSGFTTVNLLLLIIGSCLMFALGIIGEYLARIYDEIKGRPVYMVAETISGGFDADSSSGRKRNP